MNLASYKTLTGLNVKTSDEAFVTANITKAQLKLEAILGYTLDPTKVSTNEYEELGISPNECSCSIVDTSNLNDPDAVEEAYRLYRYNPLDKYLHIDPCSAVYEVKLVNIQKGTSDTTGITVKKFDIDDLRLQYANGMYRYIQEIVSCGFKMCNNENVQLAVDADWLWQSANDIPSDILYIWADMVTYYGDRNRYIKSESITDHSYSRDALIAPETLPENIKIFQKYNGPKGIAGNIR